MKALWMWFNNNGDKVLAFMTVASADMATRPNLFDPKTMEWATYVSGLCTLAHTVFLSPKSSTSGAAVAPKP
jgi:hypothetical protein